MSQLDQIRDALRHIELLANRLAAQGDSEALHDFYSSLIETHNHFSEYADLQDDEIKAVELDAMNGDQNGQNNEVANGLSFDLDECDDGSDKGVVKVEKVAKVETVETVEKKELSKKEYAEKLEKERLEKLKIEKKEELKNFKNIELYIGDKFTQYGCTFEQDLFTPNDPLKIGILHKNALLLILRKLGVYLTPSEVELLSNKFKPTQSQIDDYFNTHNVNQNNLPIQTNFINYSLFFLYIQALNNVSLTSRAVITSNVPALMAGRALKIQASNPHPLDECKENAKISGLVLKNDKNEQIKQIEAFNDPMAPITLTSEYANVPKEYIVDMSTIQKLIQHFVSIHPSPSRVYSSMKKSASHTINVRQYGDNTISIDALIEGLKTFNFKISELNCTIDIFKQYIQLYSENNVPALKFSEFVCFLQCEEPKNGFNQLLVRKENMVGNNDVVKKGNNVDVQIGIKNIDEIKKDDKFIELITAIIKDRLFSQALTSFSSPDGRQLFRTLARGDNYVNTESIINNLIDSRCPDYLIQNDHFRSFISLYSTKRNNLLNYNDFLLFRNCKANYQAVMNDELTTKTIVKDDTPLYASMDLIATHFNTKNTHLSFHYSAQAILRNGIDGKKKQEVVISQVEFFHILNMSKIEISYDQTLSLFDNLNARLPQSTELIEDVVNVNNDEITVPLVYLPFIVLNAIIQSPLVYPLLSQAYVLETGRQPAPVQKSQSRSNVSALNDEADLTELMNALCLGDENKPKIKKTQRFQSSVIEDMTDDNYNHLANSDLQQGARQHFKDHVQKRKQLRTSIGFAIPTDPSKPQVTRDYITSDDAELIKPGNYKIPIDTYAAKLHIDFLDNGGRTPVKNRDNYYPYANQTYHLDTAAGEDHPVQYGNKSSRLYETNFSQPDEHEQFLSNRGRNQRSFTSSVLKLRNTPNRPQHVRQTLAPASKINFGEFDPNAQVFTPLKPTTGARVNRYPNQNQIAIEDQLKSPEDKGKVKYNRAPYDAQVSRQAIGHLDDGFQPADTPFLVRRQAKFSKLTQKEQVLSDEQMNEMINPKAHLKSRRRTGYHNPNSVSDLMNLESVHPVYQVDAKFVQDVDDAILNGGSLADYIVENTNRSYQNIASRQLLNVNVEAKKDTTTDELQAGFGLAPLGVKGGDEIEPKGVNLGVEEITQDQEGLVFTLNDNEDSGLVETMVDEIIQDEPIVTIKEGHLDDEQLLQLNIAFTKASGRAGKSRDVFGKWSNYSGSLGAEALQKGLTSQDVILTVVHAQQLIDCVSHEPGGSLNLSGFSRLLGRGATD
jgi:hypothetical protein